MSQEDRIQKDRILLSIMIDLSHKIVGAFLEITQCHNQDMEIICKINQKVIIN